MKKVPCMSVLILLLAFSATIEMSAKPDFLVHSTDTGLNYGTIWVPDNYTTIQWAIGNASDGDTIFVRTGTYFENLVVSKQNLTLIGENKETTIIDANGTGHVVHIKTRNITITGFTVQNSGSRAFGELGKAGLYLYSSGHCKINHCIIKNNDVGIFLDESCNNIIERCFISNSRKGLLLYYSDSNEIIENNITSNGDGVYMFYYSDQNRLIDNNITGSAEHGVYIGGTHRDEWTYIAFNRISSNRYGIYSGMWHTTIQGNIISGNSYAGIELLWDGFSTLSYNYITSNAEYGIDVWSDNNLIYNNYFDNPRVNAYDGGHYNQWNIDKTLRENIIEGPYVGGNYWSDYLSHYPPIADEDWDGLGDTSYTFRKYGEDKLPLIPPDKDPPLIDTPYQIPLNHNVTGGQEVNVLVKIKDMKSGVKNATLRYNINNSTTWIITIMTCINHNSTFSTQQFPDTDNLYCATIPGQPEETYVKYKIVAYDKAGNMAVEDNAGQYYVYTVIPEFPSSLILPLLMILAFFAVMLSKKRCERRMENELRDMGREED